MALADKIKCIDIELAIMKKFDFRKNLIVPSITNMMSIVHFETDMLVITPSGYAYGFEIKVSKSDLKADFNKPHHSKFDQMRNGKTGLQRYYGKFKYFSYAVPEELKEYALEVIPEFCGLWVIRKSDVSGLFIFREARSPKKLFDRKWSSDEIYNVARLGAMRIYNLKQSIRSNIK